MWNLCFLDYQERNNKAYYFKIANKDFEISLSNTSDYFLISDSENISRIYGGNMNKVRYYNISRRKNKIGTYK